MADTRGVKGYARGARHPRWRGGAWLNRDGYPRVSAGPLRGSGNDVAAAD